MTNQLLFSFSLTLSLHCTGPYLHGDNRCGLLGRGRAQLWSLWLSNGPDMKEMHTVVFTYEVVDFVHAFICTQYTQAFTSTLNCLTVARGRGVFLHVIVSAKRHLYTQLSNS